MGSDLRSSGRMIAAVVFTAVVGVIVWSVVSQRRAALPPAGTAGSGGLQPSVPAPPAVPGPAKGSGAGGLIAGSDKGTWTRANPDTGVIESRLDYDRLIPLENGRYELVNPGAWLFSGGVPRVHIGAPAARVVWTVRDEPPEAGDLLGGVMVRVFPAASIGGGAPAPMPALESALYTLGVDAVHFEGALSQLESSDPLTLRGPGVSADGVGLVLRFSPATSKLEYIRTLGRRARIEPAELRRGIDALSGPARPREDEAAGTKPKPQAAPALDAYELLLSGAPRVEQGPRRVEAGAFRVWAMLTNGRLADGAFAPFDSAPKSARGAGGSGESGEPPTDASREAPIEIAWSGPLEIRSLPERPSELARELLRFRLETTAPDRAEDSRAVLAADTASGLEVRAGAIDYGATTRTLAVRGADEQRPFIARISADAAEPGRVPLELRASSLSVDLTSGVGAMPGAGSIRTGAALTAGTAATAAPPDSTGSTAGSPPSSPPTTPPSLPRPTTVTWSDRADFELDTTDGPAGAGGVFLPSRVTLSDAVRVGAAEGTAAASMTDVRFRRIEGERGPSAIPAQAVLDGAAEARTAEGVVKGERLTVVFDEKPDERGRAVPRAASARGNASAERIGADGVVERIDAQSIDAALARDGTTGKVAVSSVVAESRVVFTGKDRLRASAERLSADVPARLANLVGSKENPASITSGAAPDAPGGAEAAQRLAAERIVLDGAARTVKVPGPGFATYEGVGPDGPERLGVEWRREMTFDDASGVATLDGDVRAAGERGAAAGAPTRDLYKASADRARIRLASSAGTTTLEEVTLETIGKESGGSSFVEADARRSRGADELEGLVNLRAANLTVLPAQRGVRVPGPGRIIIDDRRGTEPGAPASPGAEVAFENLRGKSVIEWTGSMDTLQPSGTLRLEQNVRVRHLAPGASEAMLLEAAGLSLDLVWPAETDADQQPRLSRIAADGGVFVKHPRARLVGSALSYDAGSNEVLVAGSPERPVTVEDLQTGATTTAEGVAFDPRTGTWRATNVGTITVPR